MRVVIMMDVFALLGLRSSCLWLTPLCVGGDVSRAVRLRVPVWMAGVWLCVSRRVFGYMTGVNKHLYMS